MAVATTSGAIARRRARAGKRVNDAWSKNGVAMIYQELSLCPHLTATGNVALPI